MGKSLPDNYKGKKMLKRAEDLDAFWAYKGKTDSKSNSELVLFDNVQFIYELVLAQLELQSLGVRFEMTNGLRQFKLLDTENEQELRRKSAYFKFVKSEPTDYFQIVQKNRTRSVNQYLTHWIYPYKGKFHPQMIRALINIIGLEQGDVVADPFIGNGTSSVEGLMLRTNDIGEHYERF